MSPANIEQFSTMLSDHAQIHTPYGATEAVSHHLHWLRGDLVRDQKLSEKGFGMCVGRPICDTRIKLIKISDDPITQIRDTLEVEENQVGEITVKATWSPRTITTTVRPILWPKSRTLTARYGTGWETWVGGLQG